MLRDALALVLALAGCSGAGPVGPDGGVAAPDGAPGSPPLIGPLVRCADTRQVTVSAVHDAPGSTRLRYTYRSYPATRSP